MRLMAEGFPLHKSPRRAGGAVEKPDLGAIGSLRLQVARQRSQGKPAARVRGGSLQARGRVLVLMCLAVLGARLRRVVVPAHMRRIAVAGRTLRHEPLKAALWADATGVEGVPAVATASLGGDAAPAAVLLRVPGAAWAVNLNHDKDRERLETLKTRLWVEYLALRNVLRPKSWEL